MAQRLRASDAVQSSAPIVLDAIDRTIVALLQEDARLSVRAIARALDKSPGAIGERIARLETSRVITKYVADVDFARLGYMHTMVVVRAAADRDLDGCVEEISKLDEVRMVWVVTGAWDLVVEAYVRDAVHLRELLQGRLRRMEGVVHTEAMIVLESTSTAPTVATGPVTALD